MLLLTSLHLDDRDFWLAFGLAVVLPLWACRFATKDPSVVSDTRGGESLAERGPLWCPATPRDGVIPRRVVQMDGTVGVLPYCMIGHDVGREETIK